MQMQVNVTTKVNSASIRREIYNGREHFVIPSYTLPANVVMNGGLYPASEIDAHYQKLEGTLAPLGHPTVNGQFVSASSPEGINVGHVGAWNRNVKKSGNRIYAEKWLDVEVAANSEGGRRLIERLESIEKGEQVDPIHTSIAVFLEREPATNASGYEWVARINSVDHDAILLDEPGAATPDQGVGLMVNADQAVPIEELEKTDGADSGVRSALNHLIRFFTNSQARPDDTQKEGDMPLTAEEKAELVKEFGDVVANQLKPLASEVGDMKKTVTGLETNQKQLSETLTANTRAEEAKKRESVAAKFGKDVAEGLTGNALESLYKQCESAAPLGANSAQGKEGLTADIANLPKE